MEISYIAGYFDGDGCVNISKGIIRKKWIHYSLSARIASTNTKVIKLLKDKYGGSFYIDKRNWNKGRYKVYHWIVASKKALNFLKEIYPFSILKKRQIKVAIDFQSSKNSLQRRLSPEKKLFYENCYRKIKQDKHKQQIAW